MCLACVPRVPIRMQVERDSSEEFSPSYSSRCTDNRISLLFFNDLMHFARVAGNVGLNIRRNSVESSDILSLTFGTKFLTIFYRSLFACCCISRIKGLSNTEKHGCASIADIFAIKELNCCSRFGPLSTCETKEVTRLDRREERHKKELTKCLTIT